MKKTILSGLLAISLLALLTACGENKTPAVSENEESTSDCCKTATEEAEKDDCCETEEPQTTETASQIPDCCG